MMTREDILAFLNANPVCFLATEDGCTPHVRGMMLYRADEHGIIFHTGKDKDLTLQLTRNPCAELCVYNPEQQIQVRVTGTVDFLDDPALKQEIIASRPFLKEIADKVGDDQLTIFRVKDGVATVWTMETNLAPKTYITL